MGGGSEFSTEGLFDSHFNHPGVVYFSAAGDAPGTIYPCTSPNVVCVGGTSTARDIFTGNFLGEVAWMDAGGGFSFYESIPPYQSSISGTVGPTRGVPDIAFDGNPTTGVWIYDSNEYEYGPREYEPGGWFIVGGTSLGAPAMSGIVNTAGNFHSSSATELTTIYANSSNPADFTDTTLGFCGPYVTFGTGPGWDFCTGVGSPLGYNGK